MNGMADLSDKHPPSRMNAISLAWDDFVWVCGFSRPVKAERRREYLADEKIPQHAACGRCGGRPVRPWEQRP